MMDSTSLQQTKFEDLLGSGSLADPVQVWSEYAKWVAKHLPCEHISVLARACRQLDDPKHHDDVRLLRLWVRFADTQGKVATHTFFGSLEEQGIGTKHALLYEAWAASLEAKRLFVQADAVYEKGIKRSAQPLTRLQRSAVEFRHRMARRKTREVRKRQRTSADANTMGPLKHQRPRVAFDSHVVAVVAHKKPELTNGNHCDNTLTENIPPGNNGTGKQQQHVKYNPSRELLMQCTTSCVQSTASLATREQRPLRQSRPLTQSRPSAHLTQSRRFSLRVPIRRSLSKMLDVQSGKRRRLSALILRRKSAPSVDIASGSSVALGTTSDIQPPIVETATAGNENADSAVGFDGFMAIGEQMLADRDRRVSACDLKQAEIKEDVKTADSASWRIPRWLPFRSRGC